MDYVYWLAFKADQQPGIHPNTKDRITRNLPYLAIASKQLVEHIRELRENFSVVSHEENPLHVAAYYGHSDVFYILCYYQTKWNLVNSSVQLELIL